MKSPTPFRIVPLPVATVEAARRTHTDCLSHVLQPQIAEDASLPCRFTLRMARPGERVLLMSYSPFTRDHPYREIGPIYILADGGERYADPHRFPSEIDPTTRVFRSYDDAETIVEARVGTAHPEALIDELFANPRTQCIHVRSLTYGCYTFKIERA